MGNETTTKKETSLAELEDVLKHLPKDFLAFSVVSDKNGLIAFIQGTKIEISALLCRLQDKEVIAQQILEVAVDGFKLAKECGMTNDFTNKKTDINVN